MLIIFERLRKLLTFITQRYSYRSFGALRKSVPFLYFGIDLGSTNNVFYNAVEFDECICLQVGYVRFDNNRSTALFVLETTNSLKTLATHYPSHTNHLVPYLNLSQVFISISKLRHCSLKYTKTRDIIPQI